MILDALAKDAGEGWPAHLTPRSLALTLGAPSDFARGLRLQLQMPTAVAAASFARALESFGTAYRRTAASTSTVPFALASDPYFVDAYRFGFAFGSLPTTVTYQRRGLALATRVAGAQARSLTKTALLRARSVALGALVRGAAAHPDDARFRELAHEVFGEGVPEELAGVFPRVRAGDDAEARLQALLTTLPFLHELRDTFDEDWFRNPQAWRFLRARASGPARAAEEPTAAPKGLARAFEEALG